MHDTQLTAALLTDTFFGADGPRRLAARLQSARAGGAELAVLPELPMDPWVPATRHARDDDAEPLRGPRQQAMAAAAAAAGIAVLGGVILRDPVSGARHNTALLFDRRGALLASYAKTHLPFEEGFWEASHYEPGDRPPEPMDGLALRLGVQICSDANRPDGTHLLRARGAELVVVPRATPQATFERWKLVLRANAVTAAVWLVSVNRPSGEAGADTGGASLVIAPDGEVVAETTDPLCVVTLDRVRVDAARRDYPGYLDERAELYARGWGALSGR